MSRSSSDSVIRFLENDIQSQYLELFPSRWSNVVQKLTRSTQKLKDATANCNALEDEVMNALSSMNCLLEEEHKLLSRGAGILEETQVCRMSSAQPGVSRKCEEFHSFLSAMMKRLVLKESIYAAWKEKGVRLTTDTMKVYAHALVSSLLTSQKEIDRQKAFWHAL